MHYQLSEVHIEAVKALLERVEPCTLLVLVEQLQKESICSDLDKVSFVQQLQRMVDSGILKSNKILKSRLLKPLTIQQKMQIKEITEAAVVEGRFLTLEQIAEQIVDKADQETVEDVKKKLSFLFIPLHSTGETDDEDETPSKGL